MQLAIAGGQPPKSIYAIKLDVFEGPLDLLLHLIQKNEMEITDIRISEITDQYLAYLNLMEMLDLDVASDFLVMAATLLHLKSQSLLPAPTSSEQKHLKNREELVRQLLEYKQFKEAAQALEYYASQREKVYTRSDVLHTDLDDLREVQIRATLFDLLSAFKEIVSRQQFMGDEDYAEIQEESITVEDKMAFLDQRLAEDGQIWFNDLFPEFSGKLERIVTFLAVLELVRLQRMVAVQSEHFSDIYLRKRED
jgi:segregation and condensation protein A